VTSRRAAVGLVPRMAVLLALLSLGSHGGCDWFDGPLEANLTPSTRMVSCPGEVAAGDDVTLEWEGTDVDGSVVEYRWSFDDSTGTGGTAVTLEDVAEGEHVFEVSAVDDDGDEDPSPAVCEFTASDPGGLVGRVVLAEFLTTLPCGNCPNAEAALDMVVDEYGADSLVVIAYHDHQGPDPIWTEEIVDRILWYTEASGDDGATYGQYPAVIFDGDLDRTVTGAATVEGAASDYRLEIDNRKTYGSPVTVSIEGSLSAGRGDVTVRVIVRDPLTAGTYVLRTVVTEDDILAFSHDFGFSARDILDDEPLTVAVVGDSAVVQRSFAVDASWEVDNLDVVAFVQNDDTKEVLQAAHLGAGGQ